jgi:hypothetical protein
VAHIFLHRHEVRCEDRLDNEFLTDTAACIYGFARWMAETYRVVEKRTGSETHALGYMTTEEVGYLLARSRTQIPIVSSEIADLAIERGRRQAEREMRAAPLRAASLGSRIAYVFRGLHARGEPILRLRDPCALGSTKVAFRCPECSQGVRIPRRKRLVASCPSCAAKIPCRS